MTKPQIRLRTFFILVAASAIAVSLGTCIYRTDWHYYEYASFNAGNGRRIKVFGETTWEISETLCYEVQIGSKTVVPKRSFSSIPHIGPNPSFEMVRAQDGELVAIYDRNHPYELDVIHDFSTGQSWPADDTGYSGAAPAAIRDIETDLRRRIETEHPHLARIKKLDDLQYMQTHDWLLLNDADVIDDDLQALRQIDSLSVIQLERNKLTDKGLVHLYDLTGLTAIYLAGNNISLEGIAALKRALPNTRIEH